MNMSLRGSLTLSTWHQCCATRYGERNLSKRRCLPRGEPNACESIADVWVGVPHDVPRRGGCDGGQTSTSHPDPCSSHCADERGATPGRGTWRPESTRTRRTAQPEYIKASRHSREAPTGAASLLYNCRPLVRTVSASTQVSLMPRWRAETLANARTSPNTCRVV